MRYIHLGDGAAVAWEPTTELICTYCRQALDTSTVRHRGLDSVNFLWDINDEPACFRRNDYWYLHKRCMGIESALIRRGARIDWGAHEMFYVLGLYRTAWKNVDSVCAYLKKAMLPGAYEAMRAQWLPESQAPVKARPPVPQTIIKPLKPLAPRMFRPGHVYLLHAMGTNRIKIGRSQSATMRHAHLNTASPFPLALLRTIVTSDMVHLETMLKNRYRVYQRHNEWFELPPGVLADLLEETFE